MWSIYNLSLINEAACFAKQTQSILAIKEYKLKRSRIEFAKWALPAKLKSSDCCSHHWIAVVLGKRKEDTPVSWIAKSAPATGSSDTWVQALGGGGGAAFSQTAWNHPLHHHHLIFHDWNYRSPLQQPEQISFWLKTEATGWKLESLMVICTHWGTPDVSIPSPVTFPQLGHTT